MFKKGDKVVLKYPERDSNSDAQVAIEKGWIILGKTYVVVGIGSIEDIIIEREFGSHPQIISYKCFEKSNFKQRNLPSWF